MRNPTNLGMGGKRTKEGPVHSHVNCDRMRTPMNIGIGGKRTKEGPVHSHNADPYEPWDRREAQLFMNRVLSAVIMKGEMENIALRREALKRKITILDLQIEYWTKKARL
ncbi:unnamed protein product [Heligmosomoides polygyrus]|uniref:39S ribosomal protein L52, mitochondrial n=1 Tax=Heligmosomoides polygyrus TaxID=6339 RepID=A0A183F9T8_HELPZ|nr:unnamed protein product [Heligmosomoides polygyrus]